MSDTEGPEVPRHDHEAQPEGAPQDRREPVSDEVTDAAPHEVQELEQGEAHDLQQDRAPARPSSRRVAWSPWWRLGVAVAAVGALTWGVTAADGAFWLDGDTRPAGTGSGADVGSGAYVETALLACPGPVPWLGDTTENRPHLEVLAAGVPQSVLDAVPPRGDGTGATSSPDSASTTSTPDDAGATAAPDAGTSTTAPDAAATTDGPDAASSTAAPDAASSTGGPDAASSTAGPDEAQATDEPPATVLPDGASALRTTDERGPSVELQHGIPAGFLLEQRASALVDATGGLAPGVAGGQLGLGTDPGSRGLTVSGCVTAGERQWLVGGGAAPGRAEQLVLTNPGTDAVTVDVSVWGADGPADTTGASGIVVPGGGRVVELLDGIAPGVEAPVVAVDATGGPVVAHLAESFREGTTDRGTEVVSPVAAPATDLVVPALPAAPEGHDRQVVLRVAAPGEAEAVVDLTALTADGAVRLADQVTRVPAGHTVDVALDGLPEGATALRLRSDEPVTAGARLEVLPAEGEPEIVEVEPTTDDASATADPDDDSTEQGEPLLRAAGDLAWVGATVPSTTPTGMALPDRSAVPAAGAGLALTAVFGTTAWVTWVDEDGEESAESVALPSDTTVLVPVPDDARAVWVVGAGPAGVVSSVHVSGGDDRGPYVASTTVPQLPWLRQVTEVRPVVP